MVEQWIAVVHLFFGGEKEPLAFGGFPSYDRCMSLGKYIGAGAPEGGNWLMKCVTEEEFKREYPNLRLHDT